MTINSKPRLSRPFFTAYLFASLLLIFLCLLYGVYLFGFPAADQKQYQALSEKDSCFSEDTKACTAKQKRQKIHKSIRLNGQEGLLETRVYADSAELSLDKQGKEMQIFEKLTNVSCLIQQELYYILADGREVKKLASGDLALREDSAVTVKSSLEHAKPMQLVRYLKADEALYHYQKDHFVADQVLIYQYVFPGHQLIEDLEKGVAKMKGIAKQAEFSYGKNRRYFKAREFRAEVMNGSKASSEAAL